MEIFKLVMSQRNLKRFYQIPGMMKNLESLPPITLIELEDGTIQVKDGHHRLVAIWFCGQTTLDKSQYVLIQQDQWRPKCGNIHQLMGES